MSAQQFKTNIRYLRIIKKLSMRRYCDSISFDRRRYQHYEAGRCQPDIDTIEIIAESHDVTIDELLTEDLTNKISN